MDRSSGKSSKASIGIQCRRDKTVPRTVNEVSRPVNGPSEGAASGIPASARPRLFGYSLANPLTSLQGVRGYKWGHLMFLEIYPNGGGKVLHAWQDDLDTLTEEENLEFAREFTTEAFVEDSDGFAIYCTAILHNAGRGLPDFLEYLGDEHASLPVKHGVIGHPRELETNSMAHYKQRVRENYKNGTFRFGHLDNLSLVGTASEESGGYFPDILDMLEEIPILSQTMPWGEKSILHEQILRDKSNDGPILWIRPGEQSVPTGELGKSPLKRKRNSAINELQNLRYLPRSNTDREVVFEDRTPAHADHVGFGPDRQTTAAVGVLKSVRCEDNHEYNTVCKDTVCFSASSFYYLVEKLQMDMHEPPMSQTMAWIEEAKLNQLHREGVLYARVPLSDNDVYFLPRNIIHQFRTVTATCSIAWHVRLKEYYTPPAPTNLATQSPETPAEPLAAAKGTTLENGSGSEKENSGDVARTEKRRKREDEGVIKDEKRRKRDAEGDIKQDPTFQPKPRKERTREEKDRDRDKRREKEKKEKRDEEKRGESLEKRDKTGEKKKRDSKKEERKEERRDERRDRPDKAKETKEGEKDKLNFKVSDHSNFEKLISETDSLNGGVLGLIPPDIRTETSQHRKTSSGQPSASPRPPDTTEDKKDFKTSRSQFPGHIRKKLDLDSCGGGSQSSNSPVSNSPVSLPPSISKPGVSNSPSMPPSYSSPLSLVQEGSNNPQPQNINLLDQIIRGMSKDPPQHKKE